ncbi:MAG: non-canonical purine NTP diphosphatase [Paludibacter sp.]|nr:non-canonical purine NTP diphosphatase [Paludibacter sp.]
MKKLVFATNNSHKLSEVKSILEPVFKIISLAELNCFDDIPETSDTLEGNALIKAEYIYKKYQVDCFADDTGLEVDALNGAPGVYSARYAGDNHDAAANMKKLLQNMEGAANRAARFRTVITLILDGEIYNFEGQVCGHIATEPRGDAGFGYDPIFVPDGYNKSFAELGLDEKNKISHRALAVKSLTEFLLK